MQYVGEIISIGVALSWTITALFGEVGSKRLGNFTFNVWRMLLTLFMLMLLLFVITGVPYPQYADAATWFWLLLSGVVGFVIGDYCLFNSYIIMGSRFGQLFMTLAPMAAAFSAWIFLGQRLSVQSLLAMIVTLFGIGISVFGKKKNDGKVSLKLPLKGIFFGIGAGIGQGVGLVLSKIGIDCYTHAVPADILPSVQFILPFSATLIRCIAGFVGFFFIMNIHVGFKRFFEKSHDRKGLLCTVGATLFGPFIGVSFSLMAVQYTAAGIASTLMALTPIFILLPSYYIFHQRISWREVVGALVSVFGVSLFFLEW